MGQWTLIINGHGQHDNNSPLDIERLTETFVAAITAAGHVVESTSVLTIGYTRSLVIAKAPTENVVAPPVEVAPQPPQAPAPTAGIGATGYSVLGEAIAVAKGINAAGADWVKVYESFGDGAHLAGLFYVGPVNFATYGKDMWVPSPPPQTEDPTPRPDDGIGDPGRQQREEAARQKAQEEEGGTKP